MDPEGLKAPLLPVEDADYDDDDDVRHLVRIQIRAGGSGLDPPAAGSGYTPLLLLGAGRPHRSSGGDYWSRTSSLSHDDEDNYGEAEDDSSSMRHPRAENGECDNDDSTSTARTMVPTFQRYSLLLGLLVGGFIQLSSLGANYLLSELYHTNDNDNSNDGETQTSDTTSSLQQSVVVRFSLIWSVVTSVLGVSILLLIRVLLHQVVDDKTSTDNNNSNAGRLGLPTTSDQRKQRYNEWILQLECYFAVGTLAGVCTAWTCTDLLLGFSHHVWHSLGTLLLALVWWKIVSYYCGVVVLEERQLDRSSFDLQLDNNEDDEETVDSDVTVPSLGEYYPDKVLAKGAVAATAGSSWSKRFVFASLALGLIVGFFIQFSSLGANFVLSNFRHRLQSQQLLYFSLAWSVVASTMGVLVLTLARRLVSTVMSFRTTSSSVLPSQDYKLLLQLESFFAVGALLGVNLAWIGTDLALGVQVHYIHSLWTELAALMAIGYAVRCRLLAGSRTHDNVYEEEDDETVQLTVV